jgi:hypothetical protein
MTVCVVLTGSRPRFGLRPSDYCHSGAFAVVPLFLYRDSYVDRSPFMNHYLILNAPEKALGR